MNLQYSIFINDSSHHLMKVILLGWTEVSSFDEIRQLVKDTLRNFWL